MTTTTPQRVLFLCTGNSARSQMTEGKLRHLAGDRFEAFSAASRRVGLNPNAVKAMAEIGINIAGNRSKSVAEFAGQRFDYVFTVCDNAKNRGLYFLVAGKGCVRASRTPRLPRLISNLQSFERYGIRSLRDCVGSFSKNRSRVLSEAVGQLSVSKSFLFEAMELCVSEKQTPHAVFFSRSRQNEESV
jgi:hypothetical protein